MNWPCPLKVMGSRSKISEFQMLRKIISILVFILPVIFCEKSTERSDHIESPEMEGYGFADKMGIISWNALGIISIIAYG